VHVENNKSIDAFSQQAVNVCPNQSNQIIQVGTFFGELLLHGVFVAFCNLSKNIFDREGPPDLSTN
jgi:hypothetical protein